MHAEPMRKLLGKQPYRKQKHGDMDRVDVGCRDGRIDIGPCLMATYVLAESMLWFLLQNALEGYQNIFTSGPLGQYTLCPQNELLY